MQSFGNSTVRPDCRPLIPDSSRSYLATSMPDNINESQSRIPRGTESRRSASLPSLREAQSVRDFIDTELDVTTNLFAHITRRTSKEDGHDSPDSPRPPPASARADALQHEMASRSTR